MATVDDAKMIAGILRNNGIYRDSGGEDQQCTAVIRYINDWDKEAYSLCYKEAAIRSTVNSPHCHEVVILFIEGKLTTAGEHWLTLHP